MATRGVWSATVSAWFPLEAGRIVFLPLYQSLAVGCPEGGAITPPSTPYYTSLPPPWNLTSAEVSFPEQEVAVRYSSQVRWGSGGGVLAR